MVQTFVKRPSSPLSFEPLQSAPEDILWPGSDDEAGEHHCQKKKLRVEILGKQYLDGRPLFIQTASLQGPFEKDWSNPWARKRRKVRPDIGRNSEVPLLTGRGFYGGAEADGVGCIDDGKSSANIGFTMGVRPITEVAESRVDVMERRTKEKAAKSKELRHDEVEQAPVSMSSESRSDWLKTDRKFIHSGSIDRRAVSSPTPVARHRSRPPGNSSPPQNRVISPRATQTKSPLQRRRTSTDPHVPEPTAINERRVMTASRDAESQLGKRQHRSASNINASENSYRSPAARSTGSGPDKSDTEFKHGYQEPRFINQKPVVRPWPELVQRKTLPPSRKTHLHALSPGIEGPTPSRLAPYVSDVVFHDDTATSAGLRAISKASKPSPHAAPPSTHLSEFQYQYTRKGHLVGNPKAKQKPIERGLMAPASPRSVSVSSSGSSDFAEAFEAAQAKVIPGSIASSYSSSPTIERPETKSVKKNTQAIRRLTFTASGEPKIAEPRASSRPGAGSSTSGTSDLPPWNRHEPQVNRHQGDELLRNQSTKSSNKSLPSRDQSRSSAPLPEAQIVTHAPVQLAQVPSGPSTNLLETDKQSPKFVDLTEEDSYLNLSTQAAMLKAQRAFKEDLASPLKGYPQHFKQEIVGCDPLKPIKTDVTPAATGGSKLAKKPSTFKQDFDDDVEPMSTQAIADGISPFAVTTVKKRPHYGSKRDSMTPGTGRRLVSPTVSQPPNSSPIDSFRKPLSMATTPSNTEPKQSSLASASHRQPISKPPSSAASFSLLPIGASTETSILQDGQQPRQDFDLNLPTDPFGTPFATAEGGSVEMSGNLDLHAVIEDAGSFLGNWDVENEARKVGFASRSNERGPRGIVSGGKGSS